MDDKTRFWISKEVADTKFHHDARKLLSTAKEVTKTTPSMFITDGSRVYDRAFRKEMRGKNGELPIHVHTIHMAGNWNNNMMERLNGEFRDREKVMRGIKKKNSSIISGYQLFHNYFRPHMSLGGKTPAEIAGIRIQGKDKWKTLCGIPKSVRLLLCIIFLSCLLINNCASLLWHLSYKRFGWSF
jgi:hypothetical protein